METLRNLVSSHFFWTIPTLSCRIHYYLMILRLFAGHSTQLKFVSAPCLFNQFRAEESIGTTFHLLPA